MSDVDPEIQALANKCQMVFLRFQTNIPRSLGALNASRHNGNMLATDPVNIERLQEALDAADLAIRSFVNVTVEVLEGFDPETLVKFGLPLPAEEALQMPSPPSLPPLPTHVKLNVHVRKDNGEWP